MMAQKFEYQIIQFEVKEINKGAAQSQLNQLGLDGWEVISHSSEASMGSTTGMTIILKRERYL